MSKTQTEPTVYCIVADHLIWHGKKVVRGATPEIVPRNKAEEAKLALYLKKGWLRVATPEDRQGSSQADERGRRAGAAGGNHANPPGGVRELLSSSRVEMVALDKIRPDPTQPRKAFTPEAMKELVDSIKAGGVEQAILVRPRNPDGGPVGQSDGWKFGWYEIVYGERRWRASKEAGLTEIPAKVRELTDAEAAEKQGVENLARADLLPLEVAAQYRKLLDLVGIARLMELTGHAKNTIYGKLKLLDLPEDGMKAVQSEKIQASVGELIGRQEPEVRAEALKRVLKPEHRSETGKVTVKEAERIIDSLKEERKQAQLRSRQPARPKGRGWLSSGKPSRGHLPLQRRDLAKLRFCRCDGEVSARPERPHLAAGDEGAGRQRIRRAHLELPREALQRVGAV